MVSWEFRRVATRFATVAISLVIALIPTMPTTAAPPPPLEPGSFVTSVGPNGTIPQGFGDSHNTWAWSMAWFKGKLYVGTNRDWRCVEAQVWHRGVGFPPYPPVPNDPNPPCPLDFADMPLAAQIWQWTPGTNTWAKVYTSPIDVPNPETPGKFVPRDIGYRGMAVFNEPDGTEALYVGGMSAKPLFGLTIGANMPPQRLLRSTDGVAFDPVPQDPGTTFGSPVGACFRGMTTFRNKFYVLACNIQGSGQLYESADPKLGNNSFRKVTPDTLEVFEFSPFNGQLYVGTHNLVSGYSVVKTAATGSVVPYTFQTVIPPGAYVTNRPNTDVVSMFPFKGRLYIGGNGIIRGTAGEVIRINPDDSWDVVAGKARQTPQGLKTPLSGLDAGFSNHFNQHIWRMGAHDDRLFIGTMDSSTAWEHYQPVVNTIKHLNGYDLWRTWEGWYFSVMTADGFGDRYSIGVRTMASTPFGFFVGTANSWHGLRVMRGITPETPPEVGAPQRLEVERNDSNNVLSWLPVTGATKYYVLRVQLQEVTMPNWPFPIVSPTSGQASRTNTSAAGLGVVLQDVPAVDRVREITAAASTIQVVIPAPFDRTPLASTGTTSYVDTNISQIAPYVGFHYLVVAELAAGTRSAPSNVAQAPSTTPPITLAALDRLVDGLEARGVIPAGSELRLFVDETLAKVQASDLSGAILRTQQFRGRLLGGLLLSYPLLTEDLEIMSAKLLRRLSLAKDGLISASSLP